MKLSDILRYLCCCARPNEVRGHVRPSVTPLDTGELSGLEVYPVEPPPSYNSFIERPVPNTLPQASEPTHIFSFKIGSADTPVVHYNKDLTEYFEQKEQEHRKWHCGHLLTNSFDYARLIVDLVKSHADLRQYVAFFVNKYQDYPEYPKMAEALHWGFSQLSANLIAQTLEDEVLIRDRLHNREGTECFLMLTLMHYGLLSDKLNKK